MTHKVYILSDGGHDYHDATRYGELVFLAIPSAAKWDIAQLYDTIKEGMQEASEEDYLIISHLTSVCCVATAILVEWFGQVNFLIYRHDKYEHKKLVLNTQVVHD